MLQKSFFATDGKVFINLVCYVTLVLLAKSTIAFIYTLVLSFFY